MGFRELVTIMPRDPVRALIDERQHWNLDKVEATDKVTKKARLRWGRWAIAASVFLACCSACAARRCAGA